MKLLFAWITAVNIAHAAGPIFNSSETLTLSQALEIAEKNNPEILAAQKKWDAVRTKMTQALAPDKPRLDLERMYAPSGSSVLSGAKEKGFSITQEFPFPSTFYLRRGLAARQASMAREAYQAKKRAVLSRVRSAYAVLYLSQRSLGIFKENIELMRRFAKVAESKYAAGHATQSDALKAQVELTKMLAMNVMLEQEEESASAMLNGLLNRDAQGTFPELPQPQSLALNKTLESLQTKASAQRPELKEASLAVERAGKSLALARSEYLPNFMLQYRRREAMGIQTQDAIAGFSLPLWFWGPSSMVKEAQAEKEMAEAELDSMRVMTASEVKSAFARAQAASKLSEIYRTSVLPQAEEAMRVAESGYQAEKISFLELLDAQRSLLNSRLEYYQYLAQYEERLAELERIVGDQIQ